MPRALHLREDVDRVRRHAHHVGGAGLEDPVERPPARAADRSPPARSPRRGSARARRSRCDGTAGCGCRARCARRGASRAPSRGRWRAACCPNAARPSAVPVVPEVNARYTILSGLGSGGSSRRPASARSGKARLRGLRWPVAAAAAPGDRRASAMRARLRQRTCRRDRRPRRSPAARRSAASVCAPAAARPRRPCSSGAATDCRRSRCASRRGSTTTASTRLGSQTDTRWPRFSPARCRSAASASTQASNCAQVSRRRLSRSAYAAGRACARGGAAACRACPRARSPAA